MRFIRSCFEKRTREPIQREDKHVHGKMITWKERIKTNFNSQDVRYNMYCNAAVFLNIDSVYKQSKYHPQVYVEDCKYTDAESQQYSMLDDGG